MPSAAGSVLYVRLPCWKIYPGGVIYVADYVHKQRPDVRQHLLDLALIRRSSGGERCGTASKPCAPISSRSPGATCSPSVRTRRMTRWTW